jgi:hypothetical protein
LIRQRGSGAIDSTVNTASKVLSKAAENIPIDRSKAAVKIDLDLIHNTPNPKIGI